MIDLQSAWEALLMLGQLVGAAMIGTGLAILALRFTTRRKRRADAAKKDR